MALSPDTKEFWDEFFRADKHAVDDRGLDPVVRMAREDARRYAGSHAGPAVDDGRKSVEGALPLREPWIKELPADQDFTPDHAELANDYLRRHPGCSWDAAREYALKRHHELVAGCGSFEVA